MRRDRQKLEEITDNLSVLESTWRDDHAETVLRIASTIKKKRTFKLDDIAAILDQDFKAGLTFIRLLLCLSKDNFEPALKQALGPNNTGRKAYETNPDAFLAGLERLGILGNLSELVNKPVSWQDVITERLRHMRGSAVSGQKRGRSLEDFAESIVKRVFTPEEYCMRCTFRTAEGKQSTDTVDFTIPSRDDPSILIESKGYGATGSKQSDILPKCERIITQKRHDTTFLLFTDGITWLQRLSDLRKLVELQNQGRIARIYTQKMADQLESDLRELRSNYGL